ncbi:MAG: FkbM family methyltransferase, partial [Deltaproteobacteria bacterium]|nr:FkbM family methyltransferase [Deltaproteobacteria bacterium]
LQRVYCSSWRLKKLLPQNPVVIDVGANLGQFNFFCRHYLGSPRVLSVEPIPSCFRLLELNSGDPSDCINVVVAPIAGKISFYVARDSQLSSVIPDEGGDYGEPISVKSLPLDSLLDERCVERIDLLKIDTEGNEMDVLSSGVRGLERCGKLLVEMSVFRKSTGNLFTVGKYLEDREFRLRELIFDRTRSPKDVDGVFIKS